MRARYSEEFEREALRLCESESVLRVSERLGVTSKTLYNWQRTSKVSRPSPELEVRTKHLERENRELREANTILRKALGFMAGR